MQSSCDFSHLLINPRVNKHDRHNTRPYIRTLYCTALLKKVATEKGHHTINLVLPKEVSLGWYGF